MAYKVLAADSSPSALKAIHLAFQDSAYDVYTSDNGVNALELLMQINPDAVVIGLTLAGKNGYEIARYLKSGDQFRRIPVILLADAFDPPDKEKLKNLDFDALFQKPFDSEALALKLRTMIGENHTPATLPEEPEIDAESPPEDEGPFQGPNKAFLEDIIRDRVAREILDVERELEKRLVARIRNELKKHVDQDT